MLADPRQPRRARDRPRLTRFRLVMATRGRDAEIGAFVADLLAQGRRRR
jgi:hypothetical protein